MKIFVCVKHVPDTAATITVTDKAGYNDADVKFIANPYDEFAIEEAISIREKHGGEVVVVTVGKAEAVASIRSALAMGADRAILVREDAQFLDSSLTAKILKKAIEQDGLPDMIFTGKTSVDTEGFQTQYRLAQSLGMAVANEVSELTLSDDGVVAKQDIGGGAKQVVEMSRPCVIGATKGLNEPRYPTVMNVMKAKKKEIKEIDLADLNIELSKPEVTLERLESVPERSGAKMIEGSVDDQVTELLRILKEDEKVI